MIVGVGTDIVEIKRIEAAVKNPRFLEKCFTPAEVEHCNKGGPKRYAGYFAAKEAVAKALGTGFKGFSPAEIEICADDSGKPTARLPANIRNSKYLTVHISISHEKEYATAFAVIELRGDADGENSAT